MGGVYGVNHSPRGYLNGIKSAVKLDDSAGGLMVTKPWVITSENSDVFFSDHEDSGAWVIAESSSKVLGMVIGGTEGFPSLTYVTDIGDIWRTSRVREEQMFTSLPNLLLIVEAQRCYLVYSLSKGTPAAVVQEKINSTLTFFL